MKNTETRGISWSASAAVAVVLLAGVGGHLKGKTDSIAAARSAAPSASRFEKIVAGETASRKSDSTDVRRLEKIQKKLWEIWKSPTTFGGDPEAQSQTAHLLEQMSSAEIEAFLRSLPPGSETYGGPMVRSILSAWVLRDGPAALGYLGASATARSKSILFFTTQLVTDWIQDQPDAAMAWMNGESITPLQREQIAFIRSNSMRDMSESNPDRWFQTLSTLSEKDVSEQFEYPSSVYSKDPELRKRLLDYAASTGNPEDLIAVRNFVARAMAENDPEAAREFIQTLQASAGELAALDAAATAATARKNPESAYTDWLQRNSSATEIPRAIQSGIGSWLDKDKGQVTAWLNAIPAGNQRDLLYESSIPALAGYQHYDDAARLVENIDTPSIRAEALNALQTRWLLANPEKAAEWKRGLSADDQAVLRK